MTWQGYIFLAASWTAIISLNVFCLSQIGKQDRL